MARTARLPQAAIAKTRTPPKYGFKHDPISHPKHDPEYSIYVFHHPDKQKEDQNDWEKTDTTSSLAQALNEARALDVSGEYQKIEVKKKYFDTRYNLMLEMTLKSFGEESRLRLNFAAALLVAALLGGLFLLHFMLR